MMGVNLGLFVPLLRNGKDSRAVLLSLANVSNTYLIIVSVLEADPLKCKLVYSV